MASRKTVLIADLDLGFAFWLGLALTAAGYLAWPARTLADVEALMDYLVRVDLVIADLALPGVPAVLASLLRANPQLKVIALGEEVSGTSIPAVDAWRPRPQNADEIASAEWLHLVADVVGEQGPR